MGNQCLTHFITQNYAGNVGLTTGDKLIQTVPIGNTEEKHETRQSNKHHAKDSKGLRPKNRRNQIQTK